MLFLSRMGIFHWFHCYVSLPEGIWNTTSKTELELNKDSPGRFCLPKVRNSWIFLGGGKLPHPSFKRNIRVAIVGEKKRQGREYSLNLTVLMFFAQSRSWVEAMAWLQAVNSHGSQTRFSIFFLRSWFRNPAPVEFDGLSAYCIIYIPGIFSGWWKIAKKRKIFAINSCKRLQKKRATPCGILLSSTTEERILAVLATGLALPEAKTGRLCWNHVALLSDLSGCVPKKIKINWTWFKEFRDLLQQSTVICDIFHTVQPRMLIVYLQCFPVSKDTFARTNRARDKFEALQLRAQEYRNMLKQRYLQHFSAVSQTGEPFFVLSEVFFEVRESRNLRKKSHHVI